MKYFYIFLLIISCVPYIHSQAFTEESPYLLMRFMDVKVHEWKPSKLDELEDVLDDEMKYKDAKKGTECKTIDFEEEAGYPKQHDRFLDLSVRGYCTDLYGEVHPIDKDIMIVAIERKINEVNKVSGGTIFKVGHVQLYKRDRNKLNLIIIPISVGLTLLLLIFTFVLRRIRYNQKRKHIVEELQKKKDALGKKGQTIANVDPNATEKQRLLQLDPTVVGSASDTMGSSKEFTHGRSSSPTRRTPSGPGSLNRDTQGGAPPPIPSKDNRPPYYSHDNETSSQYPRPLRTSRERVHPPYENETHYPDMIPMQEQQPRVVIRTTRDDDMQPSSTYVPIPVQVERSGPHQRYVPPPYHSDPYYRHTNT